MTTYRGIIHGRTIELADDPGLADGDEVTVNVRPAKAPVSARPGDAIRRTAGALADDGDWDEVMSRVSAGRSAERPLAGLDS